jgi:hypothetical protein
VRTNLSPSALAQPTRGTAPLLMVMAPVKPVVVLVFVLVPVGST